MDINDSLMVVDAVERMNGRGTGSTATALDKLAKLEKVDSGRYALGLIAELEDRLQDAEARIRGLEVATRSDQASKTVGEIAAILSRNGYFRGPTAE